MPGSSTISEVNRASSSSKVHELPPESDGAGARLIAPLARRTPDSAPHPSLSGADLELQRRARVARDGITPLIEAITAGLGDAELERACADISNRIAELQHPDPVRQCTIRQQLFVALGEKLDGLHAGTLAVEAASEAAFARADQEAGALWVHRQADTRTSKALDEEFVRRENESKVTLTAYGVCDQPPKRGLATEDDFQEVLDGLLQEMPADVRQQFDGLSLDPRHELYESVQTSVPDSRFANAIKLRAEGRELLRDYYVRKYHAEIVLYPHDIGQAMAEVAAFITECRQAGGDVRRAQLTGHASKHANLLVYLREGDDEAVFWYESMAHAWDLDSGRMLVEALAPLAVNGKPIEMFQHVERVQRDYSSCWVYATKAATTLTGHRPGEDGRPGGFLIPGVIARLRDRKIAAAAMPLGVTAVRALPELVKPAQGMNDVVRHAAEDLNTPLQDSDDGESLEQFIQRFAYVLPGGKIHLDYIRQKGQRVAEILDIEHLSRQIGRHVGAGIWTPALQTAFTEGMKKRMRKGVHTPSKPVEQPQTAGEKFLAEAAMLRREIDKSRINIREIDLQRLDETDLQEAGDKIVAYRILLEGLRDRYTAFLARPEMSGDDMHHVASLARTSLYGQEIDIGRLNFDLATINLEIAMRD